MRPIQNAATRALFALAVVALAAAPARAQARRRNADTPPPAPEAAPQAPEQPPLRYPRDRPIAMKHLHLSLDVDLEGKKVSGDATLQALANRDGIRDVELDAVDLDVSRVRASGGPDLAFRNTGEKLVVTLPEVHNRGDMIEFTVTYVAHPALGRGGLYFFGPTKDEPDVPLQMWSQGESEEARLWFPCVDTPEERQTVDVDVRVPKGFLALSNGALVGRGRDSKDASKDGFGWEEKIPIPAYLVDLVVGKFAVVKDTWRGKDVLYYVPPAREQDARRSFDNTPKMLEFFSNKIGVEYPWEKYAQVCVEQFVHGGMENASATTLMERTLHDARAHLDMSSDGLVAHELAHQWWGDLLTCRDWRDIWLNEGFATFFGAAWGEEKDGADEYAWDMIENARSAIRGGAEAPVVRRRYREADECFGGGTYPKGAWVLHMLRRELGEKDFWAGIHLYCASHRASPVETIDLQHAMEQVSGKSLGQFFDQWLERAGSPAIELSAKWLREESALDVTIKQTQAGDPFAFTAEIELGPEAKGGAPRTISHRVEKKEEHLVLPCGARPRWIAFDPAQKILRETTLKLDRDVLLDSLAEGPTVVARYDALHAVAKIGEGAVKDLARALKEDPFWGIRAEAARSLGDIPGDAARDALLAGLATHRPKDGAGTMAQAKVRRAIVDALSSFHKDAQVTAALAEIVENGDPSVFVESSAARALARTHAPGAYEALLPLLAKDSYEESLRGAAIDGLAELGDPRGLEVAKAWAAPGKPRRVRTAAIVALGRLAARKDVDDATRRALAETLTAALDESSLRVRDAAIEALREIGAERALPALDALAKHDPRKNVRDAAKAAVEKIRAGAPPDAELARLRGELKDVADENKSLRDRLEKIEARGGPATGEAKGRGPRERKGEEPGAGTGQPF